jgi:hypothetical protein
LKWLVTFCSNVVVGHLVQGNGNKKTWHNVKVRMQQQGESGSDDRMKEKWQLTERDVSPFHQHPAMQKAKTYEQPAANPVSVPSSVKASSYALRPSRYQQWWRPKAAQPLIVKDDESRQMLVKAPGEKRWSPCCQLRIVWVQLKLMAQSRLPLR